MASDDAFTPKGVHNQMLRILENVRGGLPEVTNNFLDMPEGIQPSRTLGAYAHSYGPFGRIFISKRAGPAVETHEVAHATNWDLAKLYYAALNKKTPEARQFTDAFKKLGSGQNVVLANKLAPAWMAKEDPYRTSPDELTAFAVGNTMGGSHGRVEPWRGGLHVDPTLTTEYSILMDLAEKYLAAESKKR